MVPPRPCWAGSPARGPGWTRRRAARSLIATADAESPRTPLWPDISRVAALPVDPPMECSTRVCADRRRTGSDARHDRSARAPASLRTPALDGRRSSTGVSVLLYSDDITTRDAVRLGRRAPPGRATSRSSRGASARPPRRSSRPSRPAASTSLDPRRRGRAGRRPGPVPAAQERDLPAARRSWCSPAARRTAGSPPGRCADAPCRTRSTRSPSPRPSPSSGAPRVARRLTA